MNILRYVALKRVQHKSRLSRSSLIGIYFVLSYYFVLGHAIEFRYHNISHWVIQYVNVNDFN